MKSKEALKRIELAPVCECDDYDGEPYIVGTVNDSFEYDIKIVEKDLNRLEKQDKAIEIIQNNLYEARKNRDEMENDDKYDKLAYEYNKGLIEAYRNVLELLKDKEVFG